MIIRQLNRTDLPAYRRSVDSLHIPVLYNGNKMYVCDIHFGNSELCYLEKWNGLPVKISDLTLILDERTIKDMELTIKRYQKMHSQNQENIKTLQSKIMALKKEINQQK